MKFLSRMSHSLSLNYFTMISKELIDDCNVKSEQVNIHSISITSIERKSTCSFHTDKERERNFNDDDDCEEMFDMDECYRFFFKHGD